MAEGEGFILLLSVIGAIVGLVYLQVGVQTRRLGPHLPAPVRTALHAAPIFAILLVLLTLRWGASHDVRDSVTYLLLYTTLGVCWMALAVKAMGNVGVSRRDDMVERRNPAAAVVLIAAMFAHAIIYAGANVGDGPSWSVVVICALLGSGAWFLLWLAVEAVAQVADQITVERDMASAIRVSGYMIGSAIVLARTMAGDWVSFGATLSDMWVAWPAVLMAIAAAAIETALKERGRRQYMAAIGIAFVFVALGAYAVLESPPLSHNPIYGPAP